MKTYTGERTAKGVRVLAGDVPLDPRLDLKDCSGGELEWGYEGDEPAQLALAILADALGDAEAALRLQKPFMRETLRYLDNHWQLDQLTIVAWAQGR